MNLIDKLHGLWVGATQFFISEVRNEKRSRTVMFFDTLPLKITSRDRPKSAPYPRLKNSKKTSKCQVLFYSTRKSKFFEKNFSKKLHTQKNGPSGAPGIASASPWRAKVSQCRKTERVDPLRFFNIHSVAKHEKIEENKNFNFGKKSHNAEKNLKGGPFGIFQHPSCAKHQKNAGGTLWGKKFFFRKKSLAVPKKMKGSLVSPGMVCYAEKQEKPFWFSSLDQIVHFDAIIFCRTFVELLVSSCG